jgi:hypothetical protein
MLFAVKLLAQGVMLALFDQCLVDCNKGVVVGVAMQS